MKTAAIVAVAMIAAALVAGLATCNRVQAWQARRTEKRILGPRYSQAIRTPRWFRKGDLPVHEKCVLIPGEAEVFRMITEAEYAPDPKAYKWIGAALKGAQKARRP